MFTALTTLSMINFAHDAEGKSSLKNKDLFTNEVKDSEIQIKGEIDEQLKKRQIWTRQSFENIIKYDKTSL